MRERRVWIALGWWVDGSVVLLLDPLGLRSASPVPGATVSLHQHIHGESTSLGLSRKKDEELLASETTGADGLATQERRPSCGGGELELRLPRGTFTVTANVDQDAVQGIFVPRPIEEHVHMEGTST